jgi:hypothetical protein
MAQEDVVQINYQVCWPPPKNTSNLLHQVQDDFGLLDIKRLFQISDWKALHAATLQTCDE